MMKVDRRDTALVTTDPQNDFLSPEGVTWGMVGESVTETQTVEHIEALYKAAKQSGMEVFVSPHYYYPTDHGWKFEETIGFLSTRFDAIQPGMRGRALRWSGSLGHAAGRHQRQARRIS